MKKLRVTVNGKVYELVVEVLEDDEQHVPGANLPTPMIAPMATASAPARTRPRTESAPVAKSPAAAGGVATSTILAPVAGTVQKVFVEVGARVEEKAPVVMLDAMKMDTYIYAPRGGVVAEVGVKEGEAVHVGTLLIRYKSEA